MEKKFFKSTLSTLHSKGARTIKRSHCQREARIL